MYEGVKVNTQRNDKIMNKNGTAFIQYLPQIGSRKRKHIFFSFLGKLKILFCVGGLFA